MRRRLLLALILLALGCRNDFSRIPLEEPFASFERATIQERMISGSVVANLKEDDAFLPRFSPDGKFLAFARPYPQNEREVRRVEEVLLFEVATKKITTLLNFATARRFADLGAYVLDIHWIWPTELRVVVYNGDDCASSLFFDTRGGFDGPKWTDDCDRGQVVGDGPPRDLKRAQAMALALFPSFSIDTLEHAYSFAVGERGIIFQKRFAGRDNHIWLLDFPNRSLKLLIRLEDQPVGLGAMLGSGPTLGASTIFLVWQKGQGYLYLYRDGKIKKLVATDPSTYVVPQHASLRPLHGTLERAFFLIEVEAKVDERPEAILFAFDGMHLTRIRDFPRICDADIDPRGRYVAFCVLENGSSHIVIKELKPPVR